MYTVNVDISGGASLCSHHPDAFTRYAVSACRRSVSTSARRPPVALVNAPGCCPDELSRPYTRRALMKW